MTTTPERERYLQRLWERPGRLRVNGDDHLAALWWAVRTEQRRRSSQPAGGAA